MRRGVWFFVIAAIIVLIFIIVVSIGLIVKAFTPEEITEEKPQIIIDDSMPFCGTQYAFFDQEIISLDDITYISPRGNTNPPEFVLPTHHMEFHIEKDASNGNIAKLTDIYAPGQVWVTKIASKKVDDEISYEITLQPCVEVRLIISHISNLNEFFASRIDPEGIFSENITCEKTTKIGTTHETCETNVFIPIPENQVVGRAGGRKGFDSSLISMYDERIEKPLFLNPFRYDFGPLGSPVCVLNYFKQLQEGLHRQKVGTLSEENKVESVTIRNQCGIIHYDKTQTLQGSWFLEGNTNTQKGHLHLSLLYNQFDKTKGIVSTGNSIQGIEAGRYKFTFSEKNLIGENEEYTNVPFSNTTVGGTYCYELEDLKTGRDIVLLIRLLTSESIVVEKMEKIRCSGSEIFSANSVSFIR